MPYELKYEEVVICGEKLVVFQASNDMDVQRAIMISEAESNRTVATEDPKDRYIHYMSTLLYPSLAACTQGNLPTLGEFLYNVPTEESDKWVTVAKRINPHWFRFVADEEESIEKKEQ